MAEETFTDKVLSFLKELPKILQAALYGLVIVVLVFFILKLKVLLFPEVPKPVELAKTNLSAGEESRSLFSSSGRMGNYVLIVPWDSVSKKKEMEKILKNKGHNDPVGKPLFATKNAQIERWKSDKLVKDNAQKESILCVYEMDFAFGYPDTVELAKYLVSKDETDPLLPSLRAINEVFAGGYSNNSFTGESATACNQYLNGSPSEKLPSGDAFLGSTELDFECEDGGERCRKERLAQWLWSDDKALLAHLSQGITAAEEFVTVRLEGCLEGINPESAFCRALAPLEGVKTTTEAGEEKAHPAPVEVVKNRFDALRAKFNQSFSVKNYDPHTGKYQDPGTAKAGTIHSMIMGEIEVSAQPSSATWVNTFSTMVLMSDQERIFWKWFDKEYLFRRDVAKVFYGAPFSELPRYVHRDGEELSVTLPAPMRLAIDRWTTEYVVVATGDADVMRKRIGAEGKSVEEVVNAQVLASLEKGIAAHEPAAIKFSKAILKRRYGGLKTKDGKAVAIRFADDPDPVVAPESEVDQKLRSLLFN